MCLVADIFNTFVPFIGHIRKNNPDLPYFRVFTGSEPSELKNMRDPPNLSNYLA